MADIPDKEIGTINYLVRINVLKLESISLDKLNYRIKIWE